MTVTSYRTKAVAVGDSLEEILAVCLPKLNEGDIVVVTSKIVSICEGSVVKNDGRVFKEALIKKEADLFIDDPKTSAYHVILTINHNTLIANAGIDESNGNGSFILWPQNPAKSSAGLWLFLKNRYQLKKLGVIITDSRLIPMRWGTLGVGLAWCGFSPLKNYIGAPDIFGHKLRMTKASVIDGIAASAVIVMGEGNEQTPLAVVSDIPFVTFMDRPPTTGEIKEMQIRKEDDIYGPLTNSSKWKKGGAAH